MKHPDLPTIKLRSSCSTNLIALLARTGAEYVLPMRHSHWPLAGFELRYDDWDYPPRYHQGKTVPIEDVVTAHIWNISLEDN